jgi:hypothetical protein
MKRSALRIAVGAFLVAVAAGGALAEPPANDVDTGERQATRYGEVVATEQDDGSYDLTVDGQSIASVRPPEGIEAWGVTLYRVTARGPADYVLVDLAEGGLRCRHEFFVLALGPRAMPRLSERFGACHELQGAEYLDDGIVVTLVESIFDAEGDGEPEPQVARFRWRDGRITELPIENPTP